MTIDAYDLEMLSARADRVSADNHGWCFGLPPGISSAQWPLDRRTGHPMRHAFTLLLPPDHRVHGQELVALSFFGTDWQGDGCQPVEEITTFLDDPPASAPRDADLLPLWTYAQARHAHEHRMSDILDEEYAVILLTRQEFDGPLALPPSALNTRLLARNRAPEWMFVGAAAAFYEGTVSDVPDELKHYLYRAFGGRPARGATDYAIRWTKRANDPNAGKTPPKGWMDAPSKNGYVRHYELTGIKDFRVLDWAASHKPDHIGGTMRPVQSYPGFGPHYLEFEEYFGGHNFGGGNAQLDFKDMKFDWACG